MYIPYNPNPEGKSVGDCVIRALTKALNKSWDDVYLGLCLEGFIAKDMPSGNSVWGSYLKHQGFHKHIIPDTCPDCYTVENFTYDNPLGVFILGIGDHVVTVIDGNYYDTYDSGREVPIYYFSYKGDKNV